MKKLKYLVLFVLCVSLFISCTNSSQNTMGINTQENSDTNAQVENPINNIISNDDYIEETKYLVGIGNSPSNIRRHGVVSYDEVNDYYWLGTINNIIYRGIQKFDNETGQSVTISEDRAFYLNHFNDRMYYVLPHGNMSSLGQVSGNIISMKNNGTDRQVIYEGECIYLQVKDGFLYYIDTNKENKLYKYDLLESTYSVLIDSFCTSFQIENESIYFNKKLTDGSFGFFSMNLKKNSLTQLSINPSDYIVHKDSIYFKKYNQSGLYEFDILDDEIKIVLEDEIMSYVVLDNDIYFITSDGDDGILKVYNIITETFDVLHDEIDDLDMSLISGITENFLYLWSFEGDYTQLARINLTNLEFRKLIIE